jgi:phosphoheptose isomerase
MGAHIENIREQLRESCRVKQSFSDELLARIEMFAMRSAEALAAGRKLVFFGNGGSAAITKKYQFTPLNWSCACTPTGPAFQPWR